MRLIIFNRGLLKYLACFLLSSILFVPVSYAQPISQKLSLSVKQTIEDDSKSGSLKLDINYFKGYFSDIKSILKAPGDWGKSEWLKAALLAGITGGLYAYDQEIQDWVQDNRNNHTNKIAEYTKPFGDGRYTLPPLGALYLYGYFMKDKKIRKTSLESLESFIITGIFTQTIKFLGHRHRPGSDASQNDWDGPGFSSSHLSFPSGHSSSAFAIATVIASEYKSNPFIPVFAYSLAALSALSRVNDNAHWASDVFVGSAIGFFTAKAVIALHANDSQRRFTLLPISDGKKSFILISFNF